MQLLLQTFILKLLSNNLKKMILYEYYLQLIESIENLCDTEKCAQLVFELRTVFAQNCSFL